MSGQVASFLHAIREAPEDDVPRLVLADWFEDNGDPQRAEFIRTQIRLEGDLTPEERQALQERRDELIAANANRWLGPLASKPWWATTFRRGTACAKIQTARLVGSAKVQKQAAEWFTPALVTDLHTDGATSRWADFFAMPLLEEISDLLLSNCKIPSLDVQILAASPRLSGLRSLGIRPGSSQSRGLDKESMAALAESPHLRRLTGLDFRGFPLDEAALEILTTESPWPELASLNLDGTWLLPHLLDKLLTAPWLAALVELSVYYALRSDEACQRLVGGLTSARLRYLGLGSNSLADGGAEAIASAPHLASLRELRLDFPRFTERGARALADSAHLRNLRVLYVYSMAADAPPARILRERFGDVARFKWVARR